MTNKSLKLDDLKVQSFVTVPQSEQKSVYGGASFTQCVTRAGVNCGMCLDTNQNQICSMNCNEQ